MLDLANQLALTKVAQKPFDHAILAGILVSSSRLWRQGESGISFAETDSDLQPWGAKGAYKDDLRNCMMTLTFGFTTILLCSSPHAAPTSNSPLVHNAVDNLGIVVDDLGGTIDFLLRARP